MTPSVRVATWNIREGMPVDGSGKEQAEEIVRILTDANVDVVALQEVAFDQNGNSPILEKISRQTQLQHVSGFSLSRSSFNSKYDSGVAIASRLPHSVADRVRLPNPHLRIVRRQQQW